MSVTRNSADTISCMGIYSKCGGVNISVTSEVSQTICVIGNAEKISSCLPERLFFERVNSRLSSPSPNASTGKNATP